MPPRQVAAAPPATPPPRSPAATRPAVPPPVAAAAEPLPLPPPPAPPPPAPRPAPRDPAAPDLAFAGVIDGIRLGAGGMAGETRGPGPAHAGCVDAIGYPPQERRRGVTGAVGLRLRLSDDGRVVAATLAQSSGVPALDDWAQRNIRRCRFDPALRDGRPVWATHQFRVVFSLN
ncbi:energy transducer TonB, partial [Roseomonas sp. BN140053]|uniref:energy transducer TonB n=1 Tax=Roseomonas sp. BN140053 TaxID=3391898 RepID=UPI0039EA2867